MNVKAVSIFIALTIALVGLLIWAGSKRTTTTLVDVNDPNRPVATIDEESFDLGRMSVKEVRTHVFQIKNTGLSDLTLARVTTSCNCTYAYVTINGRRSPQQTMHGDNGWSDVVKPGESAEVEVVYEPSLMPVSGPVERTVSVTTTDPVMPTLTFMVKANVSL